MFSGIDILEGEKWLPINGYERYYVSSMGRIASYRNNKIRILATSKQVSRNKPYRSVRLYGDKTVMMRVHRLVANAFLNNPSNLPEIDHINNDSMDNRVENLRWCTHKENMNNPITVAIQKQYRTFDPENPNAKKWINKHEGERKRVGQFLNGVMIKEYSSIGEVERAGFAKCAISQVCSGKRKTHKGFCWKFLD